MLIRFYVLDLSAFESQILLTAGAGNCSLLVLLDLVAFDTVDYSVLLDCLHDWVDVTLSALKLLCQHSNSHLHPQISAIA